MLAILCFDICVSYLPYYTFVPILPQSMQVYGVDEASMNVLCILYALVYVPCAFLTGPFTGRFGCRATFVFAMVLTTVGCALRCGPEFLAKVLPAESQCTLSFGWLVAGQVLCALGQPFLVNSTSQMGAEWFPPNERPAAAMVSNLMNFVGGSLSFVVPSLIVDSSPVGADLGPACEQVRVLLWLQFRLAVAAVLLTAMFYQQAPPLQVFAVHRAQASFWSDVRRCVKLRDFWLVNGQFMLYVAVCHGFDAVEGSLLERYGYSASLSSWTAVSCSLAAILSTIVESICITDASSYRPSLLAINAVLAMSLVFAFSCLYFRLHEAGFVLAIGVMGLATPGWGCSFELGSEVCFPAREATVSSLLEACSNLMGVISILVTQWLLDAGVGAGVLVIMAFAALAGGSLLMGVSDHLRRREAEHDAELEMEELKGALDMESPADSEKAAEKAPDQEPLTAAKESADT